MNIQEIKQKYCMDRFVNGKVVEKPSPYYMINGKKSDHIDLVSFAKQYGLPVDGRSGGILNFAKAVVNGERKFKGNVEKIKEFLSKVKGPFKG